MLDRTLAMSTTPNLVLPSLVGGRFASIDALTDQALFEQTGVRVAFTKRSGGVSAGNYASLNLGDHVDDSLAHVLENRSRVAAAFGFDEACLVVPKQVHGSRIVQVRSEGAAAAAAAREEASTGADALLVSCENTAALLCFADCVPVIVVSPSGRFCVAHAGWRGVLGGVAFNAVQQLARLDVLDAVADGGGEVAAAVQEEMAAVQEIAAVQEETEAVQEIAAAARGQAGVAAADKGELCVAVAGNTPSTAASDMQAAAARMNVYIGPHICGNCFETGVDVAAQFKDRFGTACLLDERHVSLQRALEIGLAEVGVAEQRIVSAQACTVCGSGDYFSYRASGGVCGRHGALAVRIQRICKKGNAHEHCDALQGA